MKTNSKKICIVVPAFNEEAVIGKVLKNINEILLKSTKSFEVVVVDDCSSDNTSQVAKKHGAKVIKHILNTGSGGATATGLSYAYQKRFNIAATLDADGQHKAEDILRGLEIIENSKTDLLIGSRLLNKEGMSKVKVIGNKGLSYITYILFGVRVTDSQSGLRLYSSRALEKLKWQTSGYEFCSDMLWRAKQQKLTIKEYPIQAIYTDYSKMKGQNNWNGFNIVKSLVRRRVMELFSE